MQMENDILKKIFWTEEMSDSLGILKFSKTDLNMTNTKTVSVERSEDKIEIMLENHKININKREKLVTLSLPKNSSGEIEINHIKSNWDVKTEDDLNSVLDHLQHVIMTMNVKPNFFLTELVKKKAMKM